MFEHSVKVPRHFKIAASIFKKVSTEGGSVKTLLYDDKLRHFRTNVLYALLTESIKHAAEIDKIFENCSLLTNEPRLDPWLAKVLTTELLFGKKTLPGKSKPEQTILSYQEQFEKYTSEHPGELKTEVLPRPRYVRINTNLLTTSDAIRVFQDEGYRFIRCTSGSYDDYLKQIQGLTEYDFTQDYHVKTMFVFSSGTKLHEHELYLENQIVLQDKATTMAVHLLAPPPGSVALDMCAAPGMKTTQLAAYMRNQGKIYAVERNERRYQTLCDFVEKSGSKCVETLHKDSLEIKRGDFDDVEYILLDPSCSGSGMQLSVHNYIEDTRLAKLTSLQEKFLKHAMNSFPNAKRIVYSTCSLFPEENERVITNVVKTSRSKWRVQDVKELLKGQWNNFGSGMYGSMGTRCLYAKPDVDLTTGFFLAVLDRDQKELERYQNAVKEGTTNGCQDVEVGVSEVNEDSKLRKKNKRKEEIKEVDQLENENEELPAPKKKNKKDKSVKVDDVSTENGFEEDPTPVLETKAKKGKKKRDKSVEPETITEDVVVEDSLEASETRASKKKKKKDKDKAIDSELSESVVITPQDDSEIKSKKKKRKHDNDETEQAEEPRIDEPRKKKNKHKKTEDSDSVLVEEITESIHDAAESSKKKKKKKRNKDVEIES